MSEEIKRESEHTEEIESVSFDKKYKRKKESTLKSVLDFLVFILIVVVVCFLFLHFVAVRSVVDGNSMYPTLYDGDNLIVEKVSYYFHAPERFDIIVFELSEENFQYLGQKYQKDVHYVKRIIGLPGETIQIKDGFVYINGEKLETDTYGNEIIDASRTGLADEPFVLGENEYFVMGDNRNLSQDSRNIGPVKKKQFLGRAFVRFFPFNRFCFITHQ